MIFEANWSNENSLRRNMLKRVRAAANSGIAAEDWLVFGRDQKTNIFLDAGVGDIVTLWKFLHPRDLANVNHIYLAAISANWIKPTIGRPLTVLDDKHIYFKKSEFEKWHGAELPAIDCSPNVIFPLLRHCHRTDPFVGEIARVVRPSIYRGRAGFRQ